MLRLPAFLGLLAGGLLAQAALAADAVVDDVRLPAWLERHGVHQALQRGLVLQNRDRVVTGPQGSAQILLGDGSMVGLAADTQLELNALGVREAEVFTAAIDVPRGAVHFSTPTVARDNRQRAVNLRVGSITAGIRGTDVWGKSDAEADRICLLEGIIVVLHPLQDARQLSETSSCYVAARGAAAPIIEAVSNARLAWWVAQTSPPTAMSRAVSADPSALAPRAVRQVVRGGRWSLELAVVDSEAAALSLYDRARAAGYSVRIQPRAAAGAGYDYAVLLTYLSSQSEAAALAAHLAQSLHVAPPLVLRH